MTDHGVQEHRVLHIGKYFPPRFGGMETYLSDLMNVQKRSGMAVAAVVHQHLPSIRASHEGEEGTTNAAKAAHVYRAARWFNIGVVPFAPLFALTLAKAIKEFRPTVLHIHHPNASGVWALLLPSARRLPWVATWHADILTPEASFAIKLGYQFYRPLQHAQLARTQRVLATSEPYRSGSPVLAALESRCEVLPLGLDQQRLPPIKTQDIVGQASDEPHAPLRILSVGRIASYKGFRHLLEALNFLPEAKLTMVVSGNSAEITALEDQILRLGLSARVNLKRNLSNKALWDQYRACQVFCLPSTDKTEAFGMVLLEAQHFNLPVVACDIPDSGVPWVAAKNRRFALAQPGDAQSLALAIERVMTPEVLHDGRSEENTEIFSLENQAKRLNVIYQQASEGFDNC
ncbi:glycosyltransferase [Luminiphilus sp. nBUS_16]|uniref:glycosyltransferase n=1 Tax=Luminiphilus sp. nBUS_16 TaxID=3395315 RepID=UPI003EBB0408